MAVKIENTPSPSVLMNSMRSIGYKFKTALADIADFRLVFHRFFSNKFKPFRIYVNKDQLDEFVDKIAALGGVHRADLLKRNMVCFNMRKHKNSHILFSIDSI